MCVDMCQKNIQPGTFVAFVCDNCDHNAESMCNVTLHGTNGTIIQTSKHEFNEIVLHTSEPSSSRRHSPVSQELQTYVKSKHRPNPLPIQNLENHLDQLHGLISKHEYTVWSILRHTSSGEKQVIPV